MGRADFERGVSRDIGEQTWMPSSLARVHWLEGWDDANTMNYVGLFEGISGFGMAFKRAGANVLAVCEIDKTCQSLLRRHHPEAEIISDVKTISKESFRNAAIDVLAGGFPCQDLSVAGLRKGLDGERSGLWFEFLRIITDHKPRIVVIENVPGLLSSNGGRDFAIVLRGLVECGYGVCWRVFDSQYDGVAQRRARVFIVASLGTASCVEILFERDGSAWDSPPSREARQDVTGTLNARTSAGGGLGTDFECAGGLQPTGCRMTAFGEYVDDETASTMKMRDYKDATDLVVTPTLRSNGDAHSGFTTGDGLVIASRECAQSLTANYGKQVDNSDTSLGPNLAIAYNLTFCDANGRRADRPNGGLYVNETEQANTLTNAGQSGTVIAFAQNTRDELRYVNGDGQIAGALAAEPGMKQQSYVMAFTTEQTPKFNEDQALTLTKQSPTGGGQVQSVLGQFGVRRLTPTECERLQGFPDSHTAFGDDGKPISDSARYRMLGNAVCVPTAEWIAERAMKILKAESKSF